MKIYITHSGSFDYINELYSPIKESMAFKKHQVIFPHDKSTKPYNSRELTKTFDIVFAEVSFPSTGQGIELGWASYYRKRIICFYRKGLKYSNSLKVITKEFIEYDPSELTNKFDSIFNKP